MGRAWMEVVTAGAGTTREREEETKGWNGREPRGFAIWPLRFQGIRVPGAQSRADVWLGLDPIPFFNKNKKTTTVYS